MKIIQHLRYQHVSKLSTSNEIWGNIGQYLAKCWPTFDIFCQCWQMLTKKCQTFSENIINVCEFFEFGAVQKCANLVGLRNCCKMKFTCKSRLRYSRERAFEDSILIFDTPRFQNQNIIYSGPHLTACS